MGARLGTIAVLIGGGYAALLFHLYGLQVIQGEYYLARAESQYAARGALKAERGVIYFIDKSGKAQPVVTNKVYPLIYAVPKAVEDAEEAAHQLAAALSASPEELREKLAGREQSYELLMRKADAAAVEAVEDMKIKGIYVQGVPERFYSMGTIAAHLLGFSGPQSDSLGESGHYGVEEFYDGVLAGSVSRVDGDTVRYPEPGKSLKLTIDPNIQIEAERIIANLVTAHRAKSAGVIVGDTKTGKILAMGSVPSFDPNNYGDTDLSTFLNPVTQGRYEPGSVFKVITMAAGIDAGKITPETTFYDTGSLTLNGKKIQNWDLKGHGTVTMTNVIEKSLNTGAAFAERQTGDATFKKYLEAFGFAEKTGIDLPGEIHGDLRRLAPKSPAIAFATASFGQGVAVTPIGLMAAIGALANGGKLMRPYMNVELEPQVIREVVKPETARAVVAMMVSAVDKAEIAKISGYAFAGKTGTAQVPDFKKGGYTDRVINTYVGFGPAADPRFIVLIKLDEPEGAPVAGATVVPAFRELAQFVLNYYNIPPDRLGFRN